MAIQMRRGQYKDLDPDKLIPGEWAVSLDEKYVHMCFAPGVVMRMATYEAFEQDMLEIQTILATCQDILTSVEAFERLAEQHVSQSEMWSVASKSWAMGGTSTREGEDTNNSKYWSQQSKSEADRAKNEADRAQTIAGFSGSYNDLSDKPVIPTRTSQLTNDSGYKTTDTTYSAGPQLTLSGTEFRLSDFCRPITDWNGAVTNGWYMGANTLNSPGNQYSWYYGIVIAHNEKYMRQIVYGFGDGINVVATIYKRYERIMQDGKWGTWYQTSVSLTNNLLANQPGTALDAAQAPVIIGKIDAVDNKVAAINSTLKNLTGYVNTTVLENDYINADYLKNGNVVEVHFARNKVELKANTEYTIGFLQEGCRPPRSIGTMIAVNRQVVTGYLSISGQTGEVRVMFYSDLPVSSYTYYHFTFSCR